MGEFTRSGAKSRDAVCKPSFSRHLISANPSTDKTRHSRLRCPSSKDDNSGEHGMNVEDDSQAESRGHAS